MTTRRLLVLGSAGALFATSALAFSPGPPRPLPDNLTGICSDDQGAADDPYGACDNQGNSCNEGAVCLVDGGAELVLATARGVLTLIVDEDVAGFLLNTDTSVPSDPNDPTDGRPANARLTLLLELQANGKPLAVSETFQLDRNCDDIELTDASLCVPSWAQPLTETNLIAALGDFQDLHLQWAAVNINLETALRAALLSPADLTAHPDASVLLEVIDGVRDGFGAITADELARLDQFDHSGTDGLASVRRLKVTIQVIVP